MEMLKFGKFVVLVLVMVVVVGCFFKGGDVFGEGVNGGVDLNVGYGVNSGVVDGSLSDEVVLCVIIIFYFEYDSFDLKLEVMCVLDVYVKDLKGSGQCVVLEGYIDECGICEYNMVLGECCVKVVQCYLVLQGVLLVQLELVFYGKECLVVIGYDEQFWVQNCCVELKK